MAVDMIENGWVSSVQMNMVGDRFANLLDRDQEVAQESVPLNWQIGLDTRPPLTISTGVEQTVAPYKGKLSDTAPKPNIFNVTQPYSNPIDAKKAADKKIIEQSQQVANKNIPPISSAKKNNMLLYFGVALGVLILIKVIKK
jgi:hypothetical protein